MVTTLNSAGEAGTLEEDAGIGMEETPEGLLRSVGTSKLGTRT